MMSEEEYLAIARKRYREINALNDGNLSFYDYEKRFIDIIDDLSRELLEKNISSVPLDKRKKKLSQDLGISK
jgi:hypothetical protein